MVIVIFLWQFLSTVSRSNVFTGFDQTRQLDCLIEILFILQYCRSCKLVKTVKQDLFFFFYMDYLVLAHWIMGDDSKLNNGKT